MSLMMKPEDFVHLHVHSHFSLLEALPNPKVLVDYAKKYGMNAIALTDNGALYGAVPFYKACKDAEIKPIIGLDTYIAQNKMTDKRARIDDRPYRLNILALNDEGYANLLRITSAGFLEGFYYKPRVDKDFLRAHAKGLVAMSGSLSGEIPKALAADDLKKAEALALEYQSIFGEGNFFLELIHHPDLPRQVDVNTALKELSKKTGVPLVVTDNIFYLEPEDREGYEAQQCIMRGRTLESFRQSNAEDVDLSFGDPAEIIEYFKDVPEALENTRKIADRVEFKMDLGNNYLPVFPMPESKTDNDFLYELGLKGLGERYAEITPEIKERFEYEFGVIKGMGFPSYFIIVQDFVNWAKDRGILVGPGRGSAAGSIIAYALKITDIDPMRYGLLFERFLNPDRISMPDIDLDFADNRRSEVLEYVTQKYGADRVAGIITFGTMMPRAAVRDAARVLGLTFDEADLIAKAVPEPVQGRHTPLKKAIVEHKELRDQYNAQPMVKRVIDLAMKMEGNPRHASQHACGIVIGDRPLVDRVPLQAGQREDMALVTQYSLNAAEAVGLVKMDFLGLSNLTVIQDALDIIEAVHDVKINIDTIPLDDAKTFELLGRGETTGVFQLESDGMKRYIRDLQPTVFEDIVAMVSLYRPGPMQFIESFIRRKHGKEKVVYEHPLMENSFKETYGIPVYQEQVMQVSKDLAGFTGGEADTLRKAMGKKIVELMEKMRVQFVEGGVKNNVRRDVAEKIFQKLEDFAAYGFNKSHAACYAMIAYRTAYLKAHYPACFMAALLNSDIASIDRITIEVEECARLGITVLPPDVNESYPGFSVVPETGNIRWGLNAVKNVGVEIAKEIREERKRGGLFTSLTDFVSRVQTQHFNKKSLESLIKAGALDCFADRAQLVFNMDQLLLLNKQVQKEIATNQINLFDFGGAGSAQKDIQLRAAPALPNAQLLSWEKELLGIYVSSHPTKPIRVFMEDVVLGASSVSSRADGEMVKVVGVITEVKQILTKKKQEPMAFVKIEDWSGGIELVVFPKLFEKIRTVLVPDVLVLVDGVISVREREERKEWSVLCNKFLTFKEDDAQQIADMVRAGMWYEEGIQAAEPIPEEVDDGVSIVVPENPSHVVIQRLKEVFLAYPGHERVYLIVESGGRPRKVATEYTVEKKPEVLGKLGGIVGEGNVK